MWGRKGEIGPPPSFLQLQGFTATGNDCLPIGRNAITRGSIIVEHDGFIIQVEAELGSCLELSFDLEF